jgi:hypothetical protein
MQPSIGWFNVISYDIHGMCKFTAGGSPGTCSKSAGTLTNAEIKRILDLNPGAVQSYDEAAGVRWMTWGTNQWVSYDDGVTMQQKIAMANSLCLGGTMIVSKAALSVARADRSPFIPSLPCAATEAGGGGCIVGDLSGQRRRRQHERPPRHGKGQRCLRRRSEAV